MKKPRFFDRIHWKFIAIYMLLILIAMQVIGAYFIRALETQFVSNFTRTLDQQASLFAYSVQTYMEEPDELEEDDDDPYEDIQFLINRMFANAPNMEVQVLDRSGVVIGTTADQQYIIGQQNTQVEVRRALQGIRDEAVRINPQNGHRMQILSLPIKVGEDVLGAVYLMASMEEMYETTRDINKILATGTVIALFFTAILGIFLARTITSPIKDMTKQATTMAEGNFSTQVKVYGQDEIGQLAQAINYLSSRLSQALSENEEERNKLSSIVSHMSDGVIATDRNGQVMLMNQKAEIMLGKREDLVLGLHLGDILTVPEHIEDHLPLAQDERFLIDVQTPDAQEMILQVTVTPLKQHEHQNQGVIAVLQDVTQQEQLESERREFVANVSHELRTPLTTMKSYVETLEDGAMSDKELAGRFMKVISNETERMIRLVNDLLQLSKMDTKQVHLNIRSTDIGRLLHYVADRFSVQLEQQQIQLKFDLEDSLPMAKVDRDQMIRVLDNIISNAIKYSPPHSHLWIEAKQEAEEIQIVIQDEGMGIPQSELQHIFKRFYRVDKARSRDRGGTGLGLSIAREMIWAHQGRIHIDSEVGEGTAVSIHLPISQENLPRDPYDQGGTA